MAGGLLRFGMAGFFEFAFGARSAGGHRAGPFTAYREPTFEEIAAAPTVDKYFELREPRRKERSLDSWDLLERNMPPAFEFLNARFPAIRAMYRRKFETIRRRRPDSQKEMDRNEVDQMIDEYIDISNRVDRANTHMLLMNNECATASRNGQRFA